MRGGVRFPTLTSLGSLTCALSLGSVLVLSRGGAGHSLSNAAASEGLD